MALQRLNQISWNNNRGFVDVRYDDVTLDIVDIIYGSTATYDVIVDIFRLPTKTLLTSVPIPHGTPETTVPAPGALAFAKSATEDNLFIDRWGWGLRMG
jgi:hypothetical protein